MFFIKFYLNSNFYNFVFIETVDNLSMRLDVLKIAYFAFSEKRGFWMIMFLWNSDSLFLL